MSKTFKLPPKEYVVEDNNGDEVLRAPLLDLYYTVAQAADQQEFPDNISRMEYVAVIVNHKYQTNFTWGELLDIWTDLSETIEGLKKNTTPSLESLVGME